MLLATQLTLQNEKEDIILIESSSKLGWLCPLGWLWPRSVHELQLHVSYLLYVVVDYFLVVSGCALAEVVEKCFNVNKPGT